jgi:hypothetical protein
MRIHFRPEGSGVEIDAVLRAASDDVAAFGETLGRLRADVPAEGRPDLELAAEAYDDRSPKASRPATTPWPGSGLASRVDRSPSGGRHASSTRHTVRRSPT